MLNIKNKNAGIKFISFMIMMLVILTAVIPTVHAVESWVINTTDPNRSNCVNYVRSRVPSLPHGLYTLQDKKNIINSHTPREGAVAIMTPNHVAVIVEVASISGRQIITVNEANYGGARISGRRGAADELGILGYFDPNGSNNSGHTHSFNIVRYNDSHENKGHRKLYFCSCGAHDGKIHEEWNQKNNCEVCYPGNTPQPSVSAAHAVNFFEHHDSGGWNVGRNAPYEARTVNAMGFENDRLSSVMIHSDDVIVELYEHDQYKGRMLRLDKKGLYNLGNLNFNDIASSYRVLKKSPSDTSKPDSAAVTSTIIPDGIYYIQLTESNLVVDVEGSKKDDGTQIVAGERNNKDTQKWRITHLGNGIYKVINVGSGSKAMEIQNSDKHNGARVQLWTYHPDIATMQWKIVKNSDNTYTFINLNCNLALDMRNGEFNAGNNFHAWEINSTISQKFSLIKA